MLCRTYEKKKKSFLPEQRKRRKQTLCIICPQCAKVLEELCVKKEQQFQMLTAGSESLAITVVTMVPLTAFGATMPRYTERLNAGEKSFMS